MTRYALCYSINGGDPLPFPHAPPDGVSKLQGRDYLRECRIQCKRAGYTVTVQMDGSFTAARGGQTAEVWMQEDSAVEYAESA